MRSFPGPRVVSPREATRAAPHSPPPSPPPRHPPRLVTAGAGHRKSVCLLGRRRRGFFGNRYAPARVEVAAALTLAAAATATQVGRSSALGSGSGAFGGGSTGCGCGWRQSTGWIQDCRTASVQVGEEKLRAKALTGTPVDMTAAPLGVVSPLGASRRSSNPPARASLGENSVRFLDE